MRGRKLGPQPDNNLRLKWQLMTGKPQRLARNIFGETVHFEEHHAGFDRERVVLHRSLSRAHGHFRRLAGHGSVGKDADPDFAATLRFVRQRAPGGFNLPRRQLAAALRLEPYAAERELCAARRLSLESSATTA